MALSQSDREQFLAEPHIGSLSVAQGPDRAPLTVPIWYYYAPGEDLWINTGTQSRKVAAIRAAGRFTMMVHRAEPTARYVSVEGPVTEIVPGTPERSRRMAARYLPPEKVDSFVEFEKTLGPHVVVSLRPEHWLGADLGAGL